MEQKILIVDDEAHIRMLIEQTLEELEDEGVNFLLQKMVNRHWKLYSRKSATGFSRCDDAENEWHGSLPAGKKRTGLNDVFIVLLTAKGQELDRQKGQEVGADVYMTKPFDPEAILEKAREVLQLQN